MIKNILASIILFSIWTTLFAPLSLAQNSNRAINAAIDAARSAVKKTPNDEEKKGLQFKIREAEPEKPRPVPTPVSAAKLNSNESEAIVKRLPPMRIYKNAEDFKFSNEIVKPPKTGEIINTKFPADENLPSPKVSSSKSLQIIATTPTGNLETVSEISISFSQPMIAVSSQTEASENVPVQMSPSAKGKWRWLGTNTLIFDAENRLPKATTYTIKIPAGTKSAVGGTLEKEHSWTFSTNPPKVTNFPAKDKTVKRDEILFAEFDQEINPNDILSKTTAFANNKKVELRLAAENEISANKTLSKRIKELLPNHLVAFRAIEILPINATVNIHFNIGLPSAEGNLTTTEEQKFSFKVFDSLKFETKNCGWQEEQKAVCYPIEPWVINFNNPIDEKSFDKSQVKISPKDGNERISVYGTEINILPASKPQSSYKVTIAGTIKDIYGQTLGKDVSVEFRTGSISPAISAARGNFHTLDPDAKPNYSITTVNHKQLKVKLYSVQPEEYVSFIKFVEENEEDSGKYPTFGKLISDKTISLKTRPNEYLETEIDLATALNKGLGHVILIVEPIIKSDDDNERIVKWFQATKIGLDAFGDDSQLDIYTSNLKDGKPLNNVQLSLSNGASDVSNEKGLANLKLLPEKEKTPVVLIAKNGADSAVLEKETDYYDEESMGWTAKPQNNKLRWFVFNDRNLYRPNETVSIKGYLRKITGGKFSDVNELADSASEVNYILKDSRDIEIAKGTAKLNTFGAFDFEVKLPANINLGRQKLELTAVSNLEEKEFTYNFQVQEFRRPEFEVSTKVDSPAPFYLGDSATILTEAKYFSGGGLANADANWQVNAKPTNYTPPNRDDFTFGKFIPWWRDYYGGDYGLYTSQNFAGKTDSEGKHRVSLNFLKADPARPYSVSAYANVQDVNRQTFRSETDLIVHPSKVYVGLRTPKAFVKANESFKIEAVATDIDGKTVTGAPITVVAELKDWQKVKDEWEETAVDSQKCQIKSTKNVASCDFTAKQGGTYSITATVLDERERPNESELTVWVAGGNRQESDEMDEDEIELIPTKKEYSPNETAEILVNAPFFPAEGILILERNGIIKTEHFTMEKSSHVLQIPIEESYLPNLHIGVTLLGEKNRVAFGDERDAKLPKRPAYASGEIELSISTASRKLNVAAEPLDKVLTPGGKTKVNVAITDNNGNAVANSEVAIVAVDESVLALTNYKIDNPLDIFYRNLESNTSSTHSRESILLDTKSVLRKTSGGIDFSLYSIGGGGGGGQGTGYAANANASADEPPPARVRSVNLGRVDEPISPNEVSTGNDSTKQNEILQLRQNFSALAIFAPSVKTDANGKAKVDLQLPDNLTRYRITAVAVTNSKQFGIGESNITAKQPLMVRPSAPRFLNFGDNFSLPVVVQNQTDEPMTIDVAVRASNANLIDGNGRKITIPANDRAEIRFPVTAEKAGIARFQIGATSEKYSDAAEIEFPVYTPATSESFVTYGTTDQNGAIIQTISAPKDVYSDFGGLEITSSSTQLQELTDAFIYLQNYPFDCSEQIASRILSVAALRDVLTAFNAKDMPSKASIEAKMKADIERLQKLQNEDGGFSFWQKDNKSLPYISIHVAHALARAKAKGYAVPNELISKSYKYLNNIESVYPNTYSKESRWAISAYALYVRNLLGISDTKKAKLLLLESQTEKLSPESLGWLLSVLSTDKNSTAEIKLIERQLLNQVTQTADKAHFVSKYTDGEFVLLSSAKRNDAVVLEALLRAESQKSGVESNDLIPKIVKGLLADRKQGRWMNTQENAFVLLALDKYFQVYEKTTPNFVAKIWLGENYAGEQKFVGRSSNSNQINIPMSQLQTNQSQQNLILDKQGEGRLYYRIGMKYAPKNLKLEQADYGFGVTRTYQALDKSDDVKLNSDGSWTIRAGARIRVNVQMVAPSVRYHVALVDYLPAGLEIINPEFANSTASKERRDYFSRWFEHQNLRDNRAEAFQSYLRSGVWQYNYEARATSPGEFIVPSAKAEEMYSPETFGRSKTDIVRIE